MEDEIKMLMLQLKNEMSELKQEIQELRSAKVIKRSRRIELDSVTIKEAAKALGLSDSGIRKMIGDGRLSAYKPTTGGTRVTLQSINSL